MIDSVRIDQDFIDFILECFGKGKINEIFRKQHNQYDFGHYSLFHFLEAYYKFQSKDDQYAEQWRFHYNCSDCSFPKFKNLKTGDTEACPECGD